MSSTPQSGHSGPAPPPQLVFSSSSLHIYFFPFLTSLGAGGLSLLSAFWVHLSLAPDGALLLYPKLVTSGPSYLLLVSYLNFAMGLFLPGSH